MVGFVPDFNNTVEEAVNDSKSKNLKEIVEPFYPQLPNSTFVDSFLDFDAIEGYFENSPDMENVGLGGLEQGTRDTGDKKDPIAEGFNSSLEVEDGSGCVVKVKEKSVELEEEMGRISLAGGLNSGIDKGQLLESEAGRSDEVRKVNCGSVDGLNLVSDVDCENDGVIKAKDESDDSGSDEDSQKASSSSSSSSSSDDSDDDEDEESDDNEEGEQVTKEENSKIELLGEMEEGEIRDVSGEGIVGETIDREDDEEEEDADRMVEWTDVEFNNSDEEDEDGLGAVKGPIRSKNELKVLPPVPPIDATLQAHHEVLPVGVVLSVVGLQVIVEGVEKHEPLNEGSILWITEKRCPLGLVDEIFGPVKNPFYVVRYNSEEEVPVGIHNGTLVSFVPEFASHVLNNKSLYTKGYDASGENDEELLHETEFSDDEKEAEYMRMLKASKRGMNDHGIGKKKNSRKMINNRDGNWNNNKASRQQTQKEASQLPPNQNQHNVSPFGASTGHYHLSSFSGIQQDFNDSAVPQAFPPLPQAAGVSGPSNGLWANGVASQQMPSAVDGRFPANNMPWSLQSQQLPYLMPILNSMAFHQQFNPSQRPQSNAILPRGQPNVVSGAAFSSWPVSAGNNSNPPPFGMGFQVQPAPSTLPINFGSARPGDQQNVSVGHPEIMTNHLHPPALMPSHQLFNIGVGNQAMGANDLQQPIFRPQAILPGGQQFHMGVGNHGIMNNNVQRPSVMPGHQQSNLGRKPHHRGGRSNGGRRGRHPR